MKRFSCFLLTLVMLCASVCIASAEGGITPYASSYFNSYTINVSSPSAGKAKFVFNVTATETANTLGITTYSIQKKNSDGSYSTVYTDDVDHLASNTVSYTYSKTYSGTSGSTQGEKKLSAPCRKTVTADTLVSMEKPMGTSS